MNTSLQAASGAQSTVAAGLAENEVVYTRLLDAPRELVFATWTERRHVERWWRPKVFATVDVEEMDVRPGGMLRIRFCTAEGGVYLSRCTYREIQAPGRLVYHESCDDPTGKEFHRAEMIITFDTVGAQTRVTILGRYELVPEPDSGWTLEMSKAGWTQGWQDNIDQLVEHLARLVAQKV